MNLFKAAEYAFLLNVLLLVGVIASEMWLFLGIYFLVSALTIILCTTLCVRLALTKNWSEFIKFFLMLLIALGPAVTFLEVVLNVPL